MKNTFKRFAIVCISLFMVLTLGSNFFSAHAEGEGPNYPKIEIKVDNGVEKVYINSSDFDRFEIKNDNGPLAPDSINAYIEFENTIFEEAKEVIYPFEGIKHNIKLFQCPGFIDKEKDILVEIINVEFAEDGRQFQYKTILKPLSLKASSKDNDGDLVFETDIDGSSLEGLENSVSLIVILTQGENSFVFEKNGFKLGNQAWKVSEPYPNDDNIPMKDGAYIVDKPDAEVSFMVDVQLLNLEDKNSIIIRDNNQQLGKPFTIEDGGVIKVCQNNTPIEPVGEEYALPFTVKGVGTHNILVSLSKQSRGIMPRAMGPVPTYFYEYSFPITLAMEEPEETDKPVIPSNPITHNLVKFHAEEGVPSLQTQVVPVGGKARQSEVLVPVRNGYEFVGWYYYEKDSYKLGPNGTEKMLPFSFDQAIYGDIDLYAKWKKIKEDTGVEEEEKKPVPSTADC